MIDYNALRSPNIAGAFQQGFEGGREMKRQQMEQNALAAYAQNPSDPGSTNALLGVNPRLAIQLQGQQREQMQQQQVSQLTQAAAGGDRAAQQQLWGLAPEIAAKLDTNQRQMLDQGMKAIGSAAYEVALMPPEQRAAAWDRRIAFLAQSYPEIAKYRGQYSPENLQGVLAQTGMTEKVMEAMQPRYQAIPEGGTLVNTRDPRAVAQFGTGGLPPPPAGFVLDNGGPTPPASGNFPR